jgi:hypothetical protein
MPPPRARGTPAPHVYQSIRSLKSYFSVGGRSMLISLELICLNTSTLMRMQPSRAGNPANQTTRYRFDVDVSKGPLTGKSFNMITTATSHLDQVSKMIIPSSSDSDTGKMQHSVTSSSEPSMYSRSSKWRCSGQCLMQIIQRNWINGFPTPR